MKYTIVTLIVVGILAALLGYLVVKNPDKEKNSSPGPAMNDSQKPATSGPSNTKTPTSDKSQSNKPISNGTDIAFPGPSATKEDLAAFNKKISEAAVVAGTINLATSCKATPQIVKVTQGQDVIFKNDAAGNIKISHKAFNVEIPTGQTQKLTASFATGIYGYNCALTDIKPAIGGVLYVVPPSAK